MLVGCETSKSMLEINFASLVDWCGRQKICGVESWLWQSAEADSELQYATVLYGTL